MNNRKTVMKFFTIADYEDEELWLRCQHNSGWKMVKTVFPCFFVFESCTPKDVIYRLDYKNGTEDSNYFQMFKDYGWEYFNSFMGWIYFRKPLSETDSEQDTEIFSDDSSRAEIVSQLVKTRMLPLLIIFLSCVIPNLIISIKIDDPIANILTVIFTVLFVIYVYLLVHCVSKLRKLKKKYSKE